MIDRSSLLSDLQSLLKRLEADLLERSESRDVPVVGETLRAEYDRARDNDRTAQNFEDWRGDTITQAAAAWVLSCVFVRFLEDNLLIDPPKIAGQNERLQRARDEHELYFRAHPTETDREYLLSVFDVLAELPGTRDVFGPHNPLRELPNWLSGDAAGELLRFFQKIDANTGMLVHDFTDRAWDTRFLGDLYQDLSEAARKKYALLQTPEFVEEFILDRTLEPALDEFGLEQELAPPPQKSLPGMADRSRLRDRFKMIDPACGSGHFLLGSFRRILDRWQKQEPGTNVRELVQRTLASIHGVDVNPYAVAIARFRLLLAAMRTCGVQRLADAPGFILHLACGDSLLHTPLRGGQQVFDFELTSDDDECEHAYQSEDLPALKKMLRSGQYHAVVANPPYIVPKDRQLNERYRKRFESCHMKYSLAVPFMERIFRLAIDGGFSGQITANSFMKREFGKKIIETFLPKVDLTHVIDTSGAYIPGHGTPTVILFGRHRKPVVSTIRAVMGIRGEPSTPDDPSRGLVWSAIVAQIDEPGSQSAFVSVSDSERGRFHLHPWSIGGGGAAELKERLDEAAGDSLSSLADSIGITSFTLEDDIYILPEAAARRSRLRACDFRQMVVGDALRDWTKAECEVAVFPYDDDFQPIAEDVHHPSQRYLWIARTCLANNKMFGGKTKVQTGLKWYEYGRLTSDKLRTPLTIVYGEVATHNHFVLDRGGKVFKQTAPVIKLPPDATEDDHFALLGLLNSSVGCFWLKQVCHNKGSAVDQHGARQRTAPFEDFFAFNATKLQHFPLSTERPVEFARQLNRLSQLLADNSPAVAVAAWQAQRGPELTKDRSLQQCLDDAFIVTTLIQGEMLLVQEDLDWECYRLYGLIEEDLTVRLAHDDEDRCVPPGNRAFEIAMARKIAAGTLETTWFERHDIIPRIELPDPAYNIKYREMVVRRLEVMESSQDVALIEQPEYKRRWNWEYWESQKERALRQWLLNRLESYFDLDGRMNDNDEPTAELDIGTTTVAKLADIADHDPEFHQVGAALQGDLAFDIHRLVEDLVQNEHVPLLPILRYKPSGLRKRQEWEHTWELQRREDAIDACTKLPQYDPQRLSEDQARDLKRREIGGISVPPKYTSADFLSTGGARYWSLRGKLDVPKERWVSFPHCEGPDGTLVIAWAGYDHLQLARAISAYYVDVQERLGGRDDPRLVPLLAGLIELLPWLKQWHNAVDAEYGVPMGDYFEGFVQEEARNLPREDGSTGWTLEEIKAWEPPKKAARKGAKAQRRKGAKEEEE